MFAGAGASEAGVSLDDLAQATAVASDPADIDRSSFIIYTSGTTGRAKGVLLSIRGMLWIAAACWAPICGLNENDVYLSPLPLFHSYALNLSVLSVLAAGASEHILERFSPQQVLELLQSGKYSRFSRRADHVSLSVAARPGSRRQCGSAARDCAFLPARSCRRR